ncbi:MAG TPA: ferritin family protein [Thermodesulfovibrionales bacterium]|nr:ferritin family protein [Thermodesulfovibrionales bacterium]
MNAVEIAIKMETDAIAFYKEAAAKVKNIVGQKMFLSIREDEKRHLDMLKEIMQGLDIRFQDASPIRNVKTIFEEHRAEMMERVNATSDELEAFKIAMRMEEEGIAFYRKQASEAPSEKEKALFERLSKEEEEHFAVFSNTYFFLQNTGSWYLWEEHGIVDGGTPWA